MLRSATKESPVELTVITWNLHDFRGFERLPPLEQERRNRQAEFLRRQRASIVAVQEVRGGSLAGHALRQLARRTGLSCDLPGPLDAVPLRAIAMAHTDFNTGLLWDPEQVRIVPDSFEEFGRDRNDFWHSLATARFTPADSTVTFKVGSFHGAPNNGQRRFDEIPRLATVMERGDDPALLATDGNGISAARTPAGDYYDHDPYDGVAHFDDIDQQILWTDSPDGPHVADRRASERLLRRRQAGWHDPAARIGRPWQATTGHYRGDPHPDRRIDMFLATAPFSHPGVVVDCHVHAEPELDELFDHRPVSIIINSDLLPKEEPPLLGTVAAAKPW